MSLEGKRIGFMGGGAMAEALAGGLLAAGVDAQRLRVSDVDPARREHLHGQLGLATSADNAEVVAHSDVVVLALKPDVVEPALQALSGVELARPLWISIAAGVRLARLAGLLGEQARIVRAMPNTPALVRAGATALCGSPRAGGEDLAAAHQLFESVGVVWQAPGEDLLDAVTGLSGSGPGYLFAFLEALGEAGARVGLPPEAAARLALQTVYGAAKLALVSGRTPAELRRQVSSPGGTTLAGLERLDALGLREAVGEAVEAATRRSRELGES